MQDIDYLRQLTTPPLLTAEEEIGLIPIINTGKEIVRFGLNPPIAGVIQDYAKLAAIALLILSAAKTRYIQGNMRLVVSIAAQYQKRAKSLELFDLILEGCKGLDRAIAKFDQKRGYKFSTYAHAWIRQSITRAIAEKDRVVKRPVHLSEKILKIKKVSAKFYQDNGRVPTLPELSELTGLEIPKIQIALRNDLFALSLDQPQYMTRDADDDSDSLGSLVVGADMPMDDLLKECDREVVRKAINRLPAHYQEVIELHFGFNGGKEMSVREIAKLQSKSPNAVRVQKDTAIARMRQYLRVCEDFSGTA